MSTSCDSNCAGCADSSCGERTQESLIEPLNDLSHVKNVIAVVSGKGGVGKSLVTSLMSVIMQRRGYRTAILDADITGPSIPKTFQVTEKAQGNETTIFPVKSKKYGVDIMSINVLLENESDPVVWRGPVIGGTVRQFWSDTLWDNVDYLFVDMPPGTGDVPLTVFQSLPVDGIVIVTSPQELVQMIVKKAYNMAEMMKIPVLGIVENYSYVKCPDCGKELKIFGESHIEEIAAELNVPVVGKMPIDMEYASKADSGAFDQIDNEYITKAVEVMPE